MSSGIRLFWENPSLKYRPRTCGRKTVTVLSDQVSSTPGHVSTTHAGQVQLCGLRQLRRDHGRQVQSVAASLQGCLCVS